MSNLEDSKKQILAELKESTKLEDADFEKFAKSADSLVELVRSTRTEAGEKRIALKELQEQFNEAKTKWETDKTTLTQTREQELAALKKQIEDKEKEFEPIKSKATKYEEYDTNKRAAIKEALGNKWLPSFEVMPLFDLEKTFNNLMPDNKLIDSDNGKGKKPSGNEYFTMDELKKFSQKELMTDKELLAKVNKSLAFHNKK